MNIKDFQVRRDKLEADLLAANYKLINEFQEETGLDVSDVSIHLTAMQTIGSPDKHVVVDASARIEI